jgi:hypothetical protein
MVEARHLLAWMDENEALVLGQLGTRPPGHIETTG